MSLRLKWIGIIAALCLLGACRGEEGDRGGFLVHVYSDSSVTAMNLTQIGIPVSSGLADPNAQYKSENISGEALWSVSVPGPINYRVAVQFKGKKGEQGQDGLLPDTLQGWPLAATKGKDGAATTLLLYFAGPNFMVLKDRVTIAGTAF